MRHPPNLRSIAATVAVSVVACAAALSPAAAAGAETGTADGPCRIGAKFFGDAALGGSCQATGDIAPRLDPLPMISYAPGAVVPVAGRGIGAGQQVLVDGQWSPIQADLAGGLGFVLPAGVRAGVSTVVLGAGDPTAPIPGARAQPIRIRPALASATFDDGAVRIVMAPAVEAGQSVTLTLVATSASPDSVTVSSTPAEASSDIAFTLPQTVPGTYLATVSVDGVSSLPRYDGGGYAGPLVQIR
jgi:hypothetical protein